MSETPEELALAPAVSAGASRSPSSDRAAEQNGGRRIQVLSAEVAQQIAAGEVVTRPADAVKELIENSIDACLTLPDSGLTDGQAGGVGLPPRVDVEIRGGGLGLIRVIDTGRGIPADQLALAFERHATSKIRSTADLFAIHSLGFRGEALASIASVSRIVAYSRTLGADLGELLELDAGKAGERGQRAGPLGTSLTIRNLFQNVPARLRFLRTSTGEAGQVVHLISQYALAYPEIRFTLLNEGRLVFQSPGSGKVEDVLVKAHGASLAGRFLPFDSVAGHVRVWGFVAEPGMHRGTRTGVSIFVNRRLIQSRPLFYAIEEAYQPELPTGRHPIAALFLEIPASEIDVNVHPTKAEIRFVDERAIYSAVRRAVRETILRSAPLPTVGTALAAVGGPAWSADPMTDVSEPPTAAAPVGLGRDVWADDRPPSSGSSWPPATGEEAAGDSSAAPAESAGSGESRPVDPLAPAAIRAAGLPILHPLGQVRRTYIVAEGPDGVYFVDQHTAHERIRYEEVRTQKAASGVASQGLLSPIVVELTPRQWELLGEGAPKLRELGFDIEPFGERSCLLRAVPAMLRSDDPARELGEMIDALAQEEPAAGIDPAAALLACHSAVRAGDALTPVEIRELLGRLEGLDVWRYCPHGRPIVIRLDAAQLARDFKRI